MRAQQLCVHDWRLVERVARSATPPSKATFEAGTLVLNQFVGNVDASRPVRFGRFAGPLNVAIGAEYRRENYQIIAGEPDSCETVACRIVPAVPPRLARRSSRVSPIQ